LSEERLVEALAELKEEEAVRVVKEKLAAGDDPLKILEACRKGVEVVGKRFENKEYFLPDLIMASEILKEISDIIKPEITRAGDIERLGKVVIGTVQGDIHDIGKNVVTFMLDINGFDIYDIGVDVPPQKFVETIREVKPQIVGLSGLLTIAFDAMKETVDAIKQAGLRNKVKVMIGGSQVDERIREYTGADAYGPDAAAAVALAKKWMGASEK
jgi:methanogenic corrinoid protein MtbC1